MKRFPLLILLVCAACFAFGLFHLFQLRFEAGDVYPAYSSLRADPLGTMALCESLEQIPGLSVSRDFSEADLLPDGKNTTYLHLAAREADWRTLSMDEVVEIERFMARGGRLVVTFFPQTSSFSRGLPSGPLTKKPKSSPPPVKPKAPKLARDKDSISISERWGVDFAWIKLDTDESKTYQPAQVENQSKLPLPETLAWHSALVLTNLDPAWETIYDRNSRPVLAERKFGLGTMVMATDSFFVSNEAMRNSRHADLIAWLIGPSRSVVFDEAHLGVVETTGVSTLMRKYRLEWVAATLLLVAALFIWKNSVSFLPPRLDAPESDAVMGRDAAAGFVNLLRRNIPPRKILDVCFDEWTKTLLHDKAHVIARVDQAQALIESNRALPAIQRDPVATYQKICAILKPGPHVS
ncbi:MAG: hypothetical protein C5B50_29760 [Verrucomicrobia bacterium]|nr:MAG: hypothetical protein C5B50_29760 [Verrucomicrobiota bacterium]